MTNKKPRKGFALLDNYRPALMAALLFLISVSAYAQKADSVFNVVLYKGVGSMASGDSYLPTGCGTPATPAAWKLKAKTSFIYFDTCNHLLYVYDRAGEGWLTVGGGGSGGVDSVVNHSHPYTDSLYYYSSGTKHFIEVRYHPDGLIKPGVVTKTTGTTFNVTGATYSILGQVYNSSDTTQTLAALPASGHSRVDVIYVLNNKKTSHQTGTLDAGTSPTISGDTAVVLAVINVADTGVVSVSVPTGYWALNGSGHLANTAGSAIDLSTKLSFDVLSGNPRIKEFNGGQVNIQGSPTYIGVPGGGTTPNPAVYIGLHDVAETSGSKTGMIVRNRMLQASGSSTFDNAEIIAEFVQTGGSTTVNGLHIHSIVTSRFGTWNGLIVGDAGDNCNILWGKFPTGNYNLGIKNGVLDTMAVSGGGSYTLPTATSSVLGGVKVGSGLAISGGVLSTTGGAGNTIYTADDALTSDRYVDLNGHTLRFGSSTIGTFYNPPSSIWRAYSASGDESIELNGSSHLLEMFVGGNSHLTQHSNYWSFQNGTITFDSYGSGTVTGTPTHQLAVDAIGDVIETPLGVSQSALDDTAAAIRASGGGGTPSTLHLDSLDFKKVGDSLQLVNGHHVKVYRALLSQSGTDAPTAIELENTVGAITFTYNGAGDYTANLTGGFLADKTFVLMQSDGEALSFGSKAKRISDDAISIVSYDGTFTQVNDELDHFSIEIIVYN